MSEDRISVTADDVRDRDETHDELATGGTLAGDEVAGGSVISGRGGEAQGGPYGGPDLAGQRVVDDPALAGTVAGNTTAAGEVVRKEGASAPTDPAEDLGPGGSIIQEVGGEARH